MSLSIRLKDSKAIISCLSRAVVVVAKKHPKKDDIMLWRWNKKKKKCRDIEREKKMLACITDPQSLWLILLNEHSTVAAITTVVAGSLGRVCILISNTEQQEQNTQSMFLYICIYVLLMRERRPIIRSDQELSIGNKNRAHALRPD